MRTSLIVGAVLLAGCGSTEDTSRAELDASRARLAISTYCVGKTSHTQMVAAVDDLIAAYREDDSAKDDVRDSASTLDGCDAQQARRLDRELR